MRYGRPVLPYCLGEETPGEVVQLLGRQRLFEMRVVPGAPRSEIGDGIAHRGERDEAHVTALGVFSYLPGELESVHDRHAEIADDEIGTIIADEPREPFLAARRDGHACAELRQHEAGELPMILVIFDNEH